MYIKYNHTKNFNSTPLFWIFILAPFSTILDNATNASPLPLSNLVLDKSQDERECFFHGLEYTQLISICNVDNYV